MKLSRLFSFALILLLLFSLAMACGREPATDPEPAAETNPYQPAPYVKVAHPEWSKDATIYEVNIRQFTPEGTFKAFETHLPRLKELGVDILWLMPIHPIGEKNRKGELGSYYSVKDYLAVNPEFGTMEDFKALVQKIHAMDMYVILDWVANHSAWDHPLVEEHPEWYTRDRFGNFQPTPWYDWDDVIDFDYEQPGLRRYMTEALTFWVTEADIDGYRCDVAGFMPVNFWEQARKELDAIKPVFMLAEWESRDLHARAFDMTYAWQLWDIMHAVSLGKSKANAFHGYFAHHANAFPYNAYRMNFVTNHDKNSWEATMFEGFGPGLKASIVLTCTAPGMPLIYSGQEAGNDRRLKFFDKDLIDWKDSEYGALYRQLFAFKKDHPALWNGQWGGEMEQVLTDQPEAVLSFLRVKDDNHVFVVINYSDQPVTARLTDDLAAGDYTELFSGENVTIAPEDVLELPAWGYKLFYR